MAQKRKADHKKSGPKRPGSRKPGRKTGADDLGSVTDALEQIERKTAGLLKNNLTEDWRDNLFEIVMTRLELSAPHKKLLARVPELIRKEPAATPRLARTYWGTMKRILHLAEAPAHLHHIAAFGVLYASVIDTFLKDDTRDHAKTMAALDKRLGLFEQFADFSACNR